MRRASLATILVLAAGFAGCAHRGRPASRDEWADAARACRHGDAEACFWVGAWDEARGDTKAAAAQYEVACDAGSAEACAGLGALCEDGNGVAKDQRRSFALYQRACAGGSGRGCSNLGAAYFHGRGVEPAPLESTPLYRRACDLGYELGCSNLARAVMEGRGVPADLAFAKATWRRLCPKQDTSCRQLAQAVEPENADEALAIAREGCRAGGAESCSEVGWLLRKRKDLAEAERYLRTGCAWGYPDSCRGLGFVLGEKTPPDFAEGQRVLKVSCDGGYVEACYARALQRSDHEGATETVRQDMGALRRNGHGGACEWLCKQQRSPSGADEAASSCAEACRLGRTTACPKP